MRRRAAKLLARIKADSLHYSQQATAQAARQEGAGCKPLLCLLGSMQPSAEREDIAGESCFAVSKTCWSCHHVMMLHVTHSSFLQYELCCNKHCQL